MKKIRLTKNIYAVIDNDMYAKLSKYNWRGVKAKEQWYAYCLDDKGKVIYMHRQIMGLKRKDGKEVDHINHNTLDNRKQNLRICTHAENIRNQKIKRYSSKYKGVYWDKFNKKWKVQIMYNYKNYNLGRYILEEEAAKAYDKAAKELFGEFALLNFPEE